MTNTVLITGNGGLLGSHAADKFLHEGWQVVGVDNFIGGFRDNVQSGIVQYTVDCLNSSLLSQIMSIHKPSTVIHAACTAYEGLSVFSPSFIYENTAQATVSVLSASIQNGVKRFIFCSSMARYGDSGGIPFTEDMKPRPQDPYGIAKLSAENVIELLSKVHGYDYVILVPHNIIGPRQKYDDPYRNVAAIMINRMLRGLPPIIYGDGSQTRSFSFVSDVVDPMYRAACEDQAINQVINVGPDDNEISIRELAAILSQLLNFSADPIFVPDRPQEVKHASCSAEKARKLLGYKPQVDLLNGLESMIEFIRSRGPREFDYQWPIEISNKSTPTTWTKRLI